MFCFLILTRRMCVVFFIAQKIVRLLWYIDIITIKNDISHSLLPHSVLTLTRAFFSRFLLPLSFTMNCWTHTKLDEFIFIWFISFHSWSHRLLVAFYPHCCVVCRKLANWRSATNYSINLAVANQRTFNHGYWSKWFNTTKMIQHFRFFQISCTSTIDMM